jgi:uncharacterized protein YecE (DUF72 family)
MHRGEPKNHRISALGTTLRPPNNVLALTSARLLKSQPLKFLDKSSFGRYSGEEKANMVGSPQNGRILIGPAGWSYNDWEGIVYPHRKARGFHEAAYLAQFLDTIEINTSFYSPPRPEVVKTWIARIAFNPNFKFTAKLWKRFTHERSANHHDEKVFKQGLAPLVTEGRLGALLLQFPWSFKNTPENHEYLAGLIMQFMEYPLVLEVRHSSWNEPEVFEWLAGLGVGFCNIDQPVIGKSIAPSARATAPVGYVRLHGRNYEHWFTANENPQERYNYLYTQTELEPWATRIQNIAQSTEVTFVITNNHFQGKAVVNALQLVSLLMRRPVRVPETLKEFFPELEKIADRETPLSMPRQSDLLFAASVTEE